MTTSLIPAAVTTDEHGNALRYYDYRYPRSEAYEQAVKPTLPPGWELFSVIDAMRDPSLCARDYGAMRLDKRAHVLGYRYPEGEPRYLRAGYRNTEGAAMPGRTFEPDQLADACRWCDEQLAKAGA